jgi:hypothetical protein
MKDVNIPQKLYNILGKNEYETGTAKEILKYRRENVVSPHDCTETPLDQNHSHREEFN